LNLVRITIFLTLKKCFQKSTQNDWASPFPPVNFAINDSLGRCQFWLSVYKNKNYKYKQFNSSQIVNLRKMASRKCKVSLNDGQGAGQAVKWPHYDSFFHSASLDGTSRKVFNVLMMARQVSRMIRVTVHSPTTNCLDNDTKDSVARYFSVMPIFCLQDWIGAFWCFVSRSLDGFLLITNRSCRVTI
jgi:hypothetical protein